MKFGEKLIKSGLKYLPDCFRNLQTSCHGRCTWERGGAHGGGVRVVETNSDLSLSRPERISSRSTGTLWISAPTCLIAAGCIGALIGRGGLRARSKRLAATHRRSGRRACRRAVLVVKQHHCWKHHSGGTARNARTRLRRPAEMLARTARSVLRIATIS